MLLKLIILVSIIFVETACLSAQNRTVGCSEQERLALVKFKQSLKYDFGMLSSWVGNDCCEWEGIVCDAATGSVVRLHLRGNYIGPTSFYSNYEPEYYLVGNEVNSSLAELRHLKYLDLSGNDFQGSRIPEFIGSLEKLRYLNLSNACFSGMIPYHIGDLSNLKVLDLDSSSFNQMLMTDDLAWVSGLSSLEHLDMSEVDVFLAKNVDMVFYMIPSLIKLNLRGCRLSNADIGLHRNSSIILPNIKHLDLSSNFFKFNLPLPFQNMTSLTFLDLSSSNLSSELNSLNLINMIPSLSELHFVGVVRIL